MKRREFITISIVGATAITFPLIYCHSGNTALDNVLSRPITLAQLCDQKTIAGIGNAYRNRSPLESGRQQLQTLLLRDSEEKDIAPSSGNTAVSSVLEEKIRKDFEKGHTVIVDGWVLSVTEARQCAYFSLIHP